MDLLSVFIQQTLGPSSFFPKWLALFYVCQDSLLMQMLTLPRGHSLQGSGMRGTVHHKGHDRRLLHAAGTHVRKRQKRRNSLVSEARQLALYLFCPQP